MEQSQKMKKRKKNVSCLGALLIFCMLVIACFTLFVNLGFRNSHMVSIGKNVFYYNDSNEIAKTIPENYLVIGKKDAAIDTDKVVLYQSTAGDLKLGIVSLVGSSASTAEGISAAPTYYLTNDLTTAVVAVTSDSILAVCTTKDGILGQMVNILLSKAGIFGGLIAPALILLFYVIILMMMMHENGADDDDDDTDLAFVKAIQEKKKVQQTAEFTKVTTENAEQPHQPAAKTPKYTSEELAAMEEKEAAERAERIAAIRNRMENRQKAERPDNVPLFTSEFMAKTHTMSIPKAVTAEAMANSTAKQKEKTAEFPREYPEKPPVKTMATSQIEKPRAAAPVKTLADAPSAMFEKPEKPARTEAPAPKAAPVEKPAVKEADIPTGDERAKRKAENAQKIVSASYEDLMKFLNDEDSKL